MKIAFIHYHLNTGGVTTVIRQQVEALNHAGWQVMVLTGEMPPDDFPAEVHFIPGLGYEHLLEDEHSAKSVVQSILRVLQRRWPQGLDVVHVHNPTLAKNQLLQQVLKSLQAAGLRLLCQIHDFAEEGRPGAYYKGGYAANCHYAVINQRDYRLLIKAGLVESGCHILPNPVKAPPAVKTHTPPDGNAPVLYPVRAIRRKNIGEAILLSLFHHPPAVLAFSQPPNSPMDIEGYLQWQAFVTRHQLSVEFAAGVNTDFNALMAKCRYVLTTSITEGFGFAFLEAWMAGKAVWGRLLPDICQGFIEAGVVLDHLYEHLWVPLGWLDAALLAQQWQATLCRMVTRFKHPCCQSEMDAAWHAVSENGRIDFSMLDENFQQQIIEKLILEPSCRAELTGLNPFLSHPGPPDNNQALIAHNSAVVVRHYSPENYASRLTHLYTHVANCDVVQSIDKTTLLNTFLDPQHFSLLQWGGAM
jgi:glycosyltransferase involved in cell wall biosynthesis